MKYPYKSFNVIQTGGGRAGVINFLIQFYVIYEIYLSLEKKELINKIWNVINPQVSSCRSHKNRKLSTERESTFKNLIELISI